MQGIGGDADGLGYLLIFDTMTANQKPVRVYAIGGAGYKGAVILSGVDGEQIHLIRKDNKNLVDLIGIGLVENLDYEGVTKGEAVKVGEEFGRGQTAVP